MKSLRVFRPILHSAFLVLGLCLVGCSSPSKPSPSFFDTTNNAAISNSTNIEAGIVVFGTNQGITATKSTNVNIATVGTMNVAPGGIGINQGTITTDPESQGAVKRLPDGRFNIGGMISGPPVIVFQEATLADELMLTNHQYAKALEHYKAAIKALEDAIPVAASQTGDRIVILSGELNADQVSRLYGNAAQCALAAGLNSEALDLADRNIAAIAVRERIGLNQSAHATSLAIRAEVLFRLGRKEEARADIEKATTYDANNQDIKLLRNAIENTK